MKIRSVLHYCFLNAGNSICVPPLFQDPFDPTDFVERLAWRLTGGSGDDIQATALHRAFEEEIGSLQLLSEQYQSKIQRLEAQCREEEEEFAVTLERLQSENAGTVEKLKVGELSRSRPGFR